MGVKRGYKKTDIGVIPEDWELQRLGDVVLKVGSGITPTGGEKIYKDEGRPFIRSQNVGWGRLNLEDVAFIDDATHSTFQATEIKLNDILLNITGASIGRSAIADERIVTGNVNQHVCIIRTSKEVLNPYFLNAFLLSFKGQRLIDSFQTGGNRQGLNFGQIKTFQIPFPQAIKEQTAIATVLTETDTLIGKLEKIIEKKRSIMQGVMQKLLYPKAHWKMKTYGEVFLFLNTATYSRAQLSDGESVGYIHYGDIHTKWNLFLDVRNNNLPTISEEQLKGYSLLKDGDIVMADASEDYSGVGKCVEVKNLGNRKVIAGLHTFLLRDTKEVFIDGYRGYLHTASFVKRQFDKLATGMKVYGVSKNNLKTVIIPVPPKEEQIEIAETLSDMDLEISNLENKLEKYKQVKQGMMQQLLTGKIRLI